MSKISEYLVTLRREHEKFDLRDLEMKRVKVENLHPLIAAKSEALTQSSLR